MKKLLAGTLIVLCILATPAFCGIWIVQRSVGGDDPLSSVFFVSSTEGYAVGGSALVLYTSDRGNTWTDISAAAGTTGSLVGVHFVNANLGYIADRDPLPYPTIRKYSNGSWSSHQLNGNPSNAEISNVAAAGTNISVVGDKNPYGNAYSTDSGENWLSSTADNDIGDMYGVSFTDSNNAWACGMDTNDKYMITKSVNGGQSWLAPVYTGIVGSLNEIDMIAGTTTGYAVGSDGIVLKSTNGNSWSTRPSGTNDDLNGVSFVDANTGWAVGVSGTIIKTTNGGTDWSADQSPSAADLHDVHFVDENNGWAVGGASSLILKYIVSPEVTSLSQTSAPVGWTGNLTVNGTNFQNGLNAAVSGAGVTINTTTVESPTQLALNLTIAGGASTGERILTITNADTGVTTEGFTVNPLPSISSLSPDDRPVGWAGDITVSGTGFQAGLGASLSGAGMTVNSTTFDNSTQITLNVSIESGATTGNRTLTVTNPDTGSTTGTFTINALLNITSLSLDDRPQGWTGNITAEGTNFQTGVSADFSGAGITVNSTTRDSATQLTINISIASGATTGNRTLTVTNPDMGAATETFTVNALPTVTNLSLDNRPQGWSGDITVTGTSFQNGVTAEFSGTGITVNSTTRDNATQLTLNLSIESDATTGNRTLTVTNPDTGATTSSFTVNAAPTITSISRDNRPLGWSGDVAVNGTNFEAGINAGFSGAGITLNSTTRDSATQLTLNISIESGTTTGNRTLTLTNPDTGAITGTFTINPLPTVTSIFPPSRALGWTGDIAINGTGFLDTPTIDSLGIGITINSTTFIEPTQFAANITISDSTTTGARSISLTNADSATTSEAGVFTVISDSTPQPTITSISPDAWAIGTTIEVTITGTNFQDPPTLSLGDGISIESLSFVSSTELTADITILDSATSGNRNITVTNPDSGLGFKTPAFTINPLPSISAVSPESCALGSTLVATIIGSGFQNNAAISLEGASLSSISYNSSTEITAELSPLTSSTTGQKTLSMTNPDTGQGSLGSAFTLLPIANSIDPPYVTQGENTSAEVAGYGFQSGTTLEVSGSGVSINVADQASDLLTVSIVIQDTASTGARAVTVHNPDGTLNTSSNLLFVLQSTSSGTNPASTSQPSIESVTPSSLPQGSTGSITIEGNDFQSGAVAMFVSNSIHDASSGSTSINTSFVSSTQLTMNISVSADANIGSRTIVVTNPDSGVGMGVGKFSVTSSSTLENPTITSVINTHGNTNEVVSGENTILEIHGSNLTAEAEAEFFEGSFFLRFICPGSSHIRHHHKQC